MTMEEYRHIERQVLRVIGYIETKQKGTYIVIVNGEAVEGVRFFAPQGSTLFGPANIDDPNEYGISFSNCNGTFFDISPFSDFDKTWKILDSLKVLDVTEADNWKKHERLADENKGTFVFNPFSIIEE